MSDKKQSNTLSLLFYLNTNPYITDDKGVIQTEQVVDTTTKQIKTINKVDKSTWTQNIKVCYSVTNPEDDVQVPSSLDIDFIQSMVDEKKSCKQNFSIKTDTVYDLVVNSVKPGTVEDKPVIFCTYKPHSVKFVSKLTVPVQV